MKKNLFLFSYLFHPLFIPAFGSAIYLFFTDNYFTTPQKSLILIQVCILLILVPLCIFYLLKTFGRADSMMLSNASQRKIPLIAQAFLIFILVTKSITDSIPELHYFLLGGMWSALAAFILLFGRIKASLHMLGVSGLTGFVIGLSLHNQANDLYLVALLLILNGLVAASRLEMHAHTATELVVGFLSGMLPQLMLWPLWL